MTETSTLTIAHTGGPPITVTKTTSAAKDGAEHIEQITLSPDAAVKHLELGEHSSVAIVEATPAT